MSNISDKLSEAIGLLEEISEMLNHAGSDLNIERPLAPIDLQVAFPRMRESEIRFMIALLRRSGREVTDRDLARETGLGVGSIKVYACACRSYFYESGVDPSIVRIRGSGYRISADAVAAITAFARG